MYGNVGRFTPGAAAGVPVLAATGAPALAWIAVGTVVTVGVGALVLRSARRADEAEVQA